MGPPDPTTDPALGDFVRLEVPGTWMLVRRGYEGQAERLGLLGVPEPEAGTVGGGRGPHPLVRLGGGQVAVVRGYRRGGAMRHLNRDRYFLGHRALEELRVTERARAAGVRVPLTLAAAEHRRGLGYTATLATLWIEGARTLPEWLASVEPSRHAPGLREAGRQVSRMHEAGIRHPDLNLRNFLLTAGGAGGDPLAYLLDFDRARAHAGPAPSRLRARDLRRLARSARKLRVDFGADGWAAFRDGYGSDWPPGLSLA